MKNLDLQPVHFLGFNYPMVFPFTGGVPEAIEILNVKFKAIA